LARTSFAPLAESLPNSLTTSAPNSSSVNIVRTASPLSLGIGLHLGRTSPTVQPRGFVIAGDSQGGLTIWDWDAEPTEAKAGGRLTVHGCRTWAAHDDGGVTAIAIDGPILTTGR
jgi:hypothetical protein